MSSAAVRTSSMRSCGTITTPSISPNTKSLGWITVSPILIVVWYSLMFQRPTELAEHLKAANTGYCMALTKSRSRTPPSSTPPARRGGHHLAPMRAIDAAATRPDRYGAGCDAIQHVQAGLRVVIRRAGAWVALSREGKSGDAVRGGQGCQVAG